MNNWDAVPNQFQNNYEYIVKQSVVDENIFNTFRSHPLYNVIIGNNMPPYEISAYWNKLQNNTFMMSKIDNIKLMDQIGGPEINPIINMSARNLKYMHSAMIIKEYFNDIKNIVEIGVGYGGLCYTLYQYFDILSYSLIDIEYVVELSRKFLSKLNITPVDSTPPYDICISECAITELNDDAIDDYYNQYITNSNKLLIRTNFADSNRMARFVNKVKDIFDIKMITDYPGAKENPTAILGWHK
jgi:hypothetical protein